jgi:hypothetical protein
MEGFRRDDYVCAGVVLLFFLKKMASRAAWRWFWPAIACGLAAIALDIRYDDIGMQLYEELLETLSSTLFLCGLFRYWGRGDSKRWGQLKEEDVKEI